MFGGTRTSKRWASLRTADEAAMLLLAAKLSRLASKAVRVVQIIDHQSPRLAQAPCPSRSASQFRRSTGTVAEVEARHRKRLAVAAARLLR